MAEVPIGVVFHPKSRCLIDRYLVPRALHDHVPDDAMTEGVDVYTTRPEALPFPRRNIGRRYRHQVVWGYFFTTRPEAGVSSTNSRNVAAGGRWCWCGHEKGYDDDDGDVYAFRTRFAFYEDDGKLTPWRMKEYRLNEGAARFRGVAFHAGATNLVVWKVYLYYKVEIAAEDPPMEYSRCDHGDENKGKTPKRIKTATNQTIRPSTAQSTATHVPAPGKPRLCVANLPRGFIFHPNCRSLIESYFIPRALHGRVPDNVLQDGVAEGVDVYTTRPEALPFPSRNHGERYSKHGVWGYFFTTRPAVAAAGGSSENVRNVAAGGRWCWCGFEKEYADDNGEVHAFRTRFAFYEDDGKLTPWRMKEYRLNEGAARFRGVPFHRGAANLVVWKVYYKVEIAKEEPPMVYYSSEDGGDNEGLSPKTGDSTASTVTTGSDSD
jgi:hypothetical protein